MDGVFLANVNFLIGLNSRFHQQLLLSGEYFANLTHGTQSNCRIAKFRGLLRVWSSAYKTSHLIIMIIDGQEHPIFRKKIRCQDNLPRTFLRILLFGSWKSM
jgi:hypothetical protein